MKFIVRSLLVAVVLVIVLATYVGITAGREVLAARSVLSDAASGNLERSEITRAKLHVRRANQHLTSLPAKLLRIVPVARQNVDAGAAITQSLIPVLDAAVELQGALEALEDAGVWKRGAVDLGLVQGVAGPVDREAEALRDLVREARANRNGWLLPPVWEQLDSIVQEYAPVAETAATASKLLQNIDRLLGTSEPRTYLVMLINNAELRGAGGILSGVGSVRFSEGRLSIGKFYPVHHLREKPYEKVEAPRDFERRFGVYKADTTLWLNATYSPDLPDVALVASRLFEKTTGKATDGAIVLDPRGVEALARPGSAVEIESLGLEIDRDRLASFVYSDVYQRFSDQNVRRLALLEVGRQVFDDLRSGDVSPAQLEELGEAVDAGHVRMVSFHQAERKLFAELGVAGELSAQPDTATIHVTAQNLGSGNGQGTKLDYWAERHVHQACDIGEKEATCATELAIHNEAPRGLGEYVGGRPYGRLRAYLETYVPASAGLQEATLNGEVVDVRIEPDEGHHSVGVFASADLGERIVYRVTYTIPVVGRSLDLQLRPQPLARDARLSLDLTVPEGWRLTLDGEDLPFGGVELDWREAVRIQAEPDPRSGLAAFWRGFTRFWNQPL